VLDPSQLLPAEEGPLALLALAASAAVEYLFPPFPGDTVTLFGGFLVAARGWSLPAVFGAVAAGGLVGAWLDLAAGAWLQRRRARQPASPRGAQLDRLVARFRRHGPWLILLNRFFPGIRALFFVAAGMAGMPRGPVLAWALLGGLLWNAAVVGLGVALGASWERLQGFVTSYTQVAWGLLALVGLGLALRWGWARRRAARAGAAMGQGEEGAAAVSGAGPGTPAVGEPSASGRPASDPPTRRSSPSP